MDLKMKYMNKSLHKQKDSCAHGSRAAPAVRTVTVSSRPDRGLCFETVQQAFSLSYLPGGLAWPGVTLARSVCLFSTFSFAHLPPTEIQTHFLPQDHINRNKIYPCHVSCYHSNIQATTMWHSCPLWNPPSHWYQCGITCRTTRKDRHGGSTPLPICLGYCTTDFFLLCLPCGKTDHYLNKWQLSKRYAPYTHGANHILIHLSGRGSFLMLLHASYLLKNVIIIPGIVDSALADGRDQN